MDESALRERHFVEEIGLLFQEMGGGPMMGRVLARLMVCDPPEQSLTEIADYLDASKGSVSTITRQMLQGRLIEKVPRPGSRAVYYRFRDDAFVEIFERRMVYTRMVLAKAEEGLALLADRPPEQRRRLEHMVRFYRYFVGRFPQILQEWHDAQEDT